ncbi:hypothetical protein FRB90_000650 [Tulasnella sp. 427]|nr:hypothetical protein FRB90_000650 [Tulasnella sp. 427]
MTSTLQSTKLLKPISGSLKITPTYSQPQTYRFSTSSMSQSIQVNPGQPVQAAINKVLGGTTFQQKDVINFAGRTAVVTGGTAGIGYEVAKSLALAGARVVLLSRKPEHGEEAISTIKTLAAEDPNNTVDIDIEFIPCDFGKLSNVKEVADKIREKEPRIDILVNDAGIGVNAFGLDDDGIERIFGVNVLGHFLFINRLLPLIRKTAVEPNTPPPRIVSLSSNLHQLAPSSAQFKSLEELNNPDLREDQYYDRSKLAIILYIKALVEHAIKPNSEKIYAFSTHPGAVKTEIQEQPMEAFGYLPGLALKYLTQPFMRTPEGGSLSTLWAAVAPDIEDNNTYSDINGAYITDPGKVGGETSQADDMQLAENVWSLCENLIKEKLGHDALFGWGEVIKTPY